MIVAYKKFISTIQFVLLLSFSPLYTQNIPFTPPVYNYTTNNYRAGNQNWSVAQDKQGVVYFGNNNGLLSFDGTNWFLHSLPNNLSVKSIFIDSVKSPERIYVGSFEEFGYFEKDETETLIYHSLKEKVKDYNFHNDEIWSIHLLDNSVYFQSFSKIFVYNGNDIEVLDPYPAVLYFFPIDNITYAQLINSGLAVFNGNNFQEIIDRNRLNNDDVVFIHQIDDELLLITSKSGLFRYSVEKDLLYPWKIDIEEEIKEAVINRAIVVDSTQFILGTINKGIYSFNNKGEVLWNINRNNGLYNNTVLALFNDRNNNIWVGLDNGVSNIRINSPFAIYEPKEPQIGLVEDILFHDNVIYLATNQGVYLYSPENLSFTSLPEFDFQTWFIKHFNNQIFIGHNFGTSILENNKAIPVIGANTGGTDIIEATIHGENVLLQSSYTSLYLYKKNDTGLWTFSHRIDGFSDLIKNIEVDHTGNIWAEHMYKGIYRIKLNRDLKSIGEIENILSFDTMVSYSSPQLNLMKLRGRIVFTDGNSFYTYDDIIQKIIRFDLLNENLAGLADTYSIIEVTNELLWFIRKNEFTLVRYKNGKYEIYDRLNYNMLNNPPNEGRSSVFVTENGVSYFNLNGGIGKYTLRPQKIEMDSTSSLHFSSIRLFSRGNEEDKYLNPHVKGNIDYKFNNIDFSFSYPEFSKANIKIKTFLEGYDNRWIDTDANHFVSYNNLSAGDYILYGRVYDSSNRILSSVKYSFEVKNPWYITWYALLFYIIFILSILAIISKNHVQSIIRKKSEMFAEQENKRLIQIEQQDKQIIKLRVEKLEADLTYKGKELASATMLNINHNEFLKKLKSQIQQFTLEGKINRLESKKLQSMIGENISYEEEWKVFQENFDLIHENFFRNLKERYPTLTPGDLKLCALLRLNYSTKEITRLLNISMRGVESARYRLRKKLSLDESANLVEFLINFR